MGFICDFYELELTRPKVRPRVAIDLHGTFDNDDYNFKDLFLKSRDKVDFIILSGSSIVDMSMAMIDCISLDEDKNNMDIVYMLSIIDYCKMTGVPLIHMYNETRHRYEQYCSAPLWWAMKAVMCSAYDIDILIDDKWEYLSYIGDEHNTHAIHANPNCADGYLISEIEDKINNI